MLPHIEAKHKAIREKYHRLYREGLRDDVIAARLAKEFYYSPVTISQIVWQSGGYSKKRG